MPVATAVAMFFLIWWVVLFAVLPWGVRGQQEDGAIVPGTDPGAPAVPMLGRKLMWTTVVTAVIFATFYGVISLHAVTFDSLFGSGVGR